MPTEPLPDDYRRLLSADDAERLAEAVQRPLLPAIRVNTLKVEAADALRDWTSAYGWQVRPVPFCATGWQILSGERSPGGKLEHRFGFYYVQEAASMLPVELFRCDQDWPLVLDLAASPGGKTTHLVSRIADRGLVVANDVSESRIAALCANLQDWGASCAAVTHFPGERLGGWFPEMFDLALLDAPCSGESLRTAERRRTRTVSVKERQQLQRRQVRLLDAAFQALRPGGQLVYATCSLSPDEDEAVLDGLLRLYPAQAVVESVERVLPIPAPGLAADGERVFDPQVRRAVRLWPHLYDTSGFFAALVGKRGSAAGRPQPPPVSPLTDWGFAPLRREEEAGIYARLLDGYGFDLAAVVEEQGLALWRRGPHVHAIPELFLSRLPDLPCVMVGLLIGELGEGFVLSHELAARFGGRMGAGRLRLSDEEAAMWLAGRDLRGMGERGGALGAVVLLEDGRGRLLGRGKVLRERVKNMLPRRISESANRRMGE
jgi:16S rRNA (cytosine1407-C5)-methyltransferase